MDAETTRPPHVVIVGAGFAGLAAAKELARLRLSGGERQRQPVRVTVVDRHNFHTFQPLLYQVATAGLDAENIAHAVRGIIRGPGFSFRLGSVESVDWEQRELVLDDGRLGFDYLVLAAGADTETFGVPGADEHTFPLKSLDDAVSLRNHVLEQFETHAAAVVAGVEDDPGRLTFVIVGGGPTGVELAGAFVELFEHVLAKDFAGVDVSAARVVLVEATDRLLRTFNPASGRHAQRTLARRGVEVLLSTAVEEITPASVRLRDRPEIAAATIVWAAGVRAARLGDRLELPQARGGRVVVDADLSVPGHDSVFVIGDLAGATDTRGHLYPQLAPVAMQQGRHVAAQIGRRLDGEPGERFVYRDRGQMATIGRHAAVAELARGRLRFRGFVAWLMWLGLHLIELIGFRNRASVLLDWAWSYVTYDRTARLIFGEGDGQPRPVRSWSSSMRLDASALDSSGSKGSPASRESVSR